MLTRQKPRNDGESHTRELEAEAAGAAASAANAPSEVWKYGWAKRGNTIHERFSDGSLPPLFRTIDNFTGGVATSFKSIDLNAATYQKAAQLSYRLNDYVDKLGNYDGGALGDTKVPLSEIQGRVLNAIVPRDAMTDSQYAVIEAATRRALTANKYPVKIVVTEY